MADGEPPQAAPLPLDGVILPTTNLNKQKSLPTVRQRNFNIEGLVQPLDSNTNPRKEIVKQQQLPTQTVYSDVVKGIVSSSLCNSNSTIHAHQSHVQHQQQNIPTLFSDPVRPNCSQFTTQRLLQTETFTLAATSTYQGKPAVIFPLSEKHVLVDKLKYVLVGKFSHGRPPLDSIKKFFIQLKLKESCNSAIFDIKHIFIECFCKEDYYRIWLKLKWIIDGYAMRVFKWSTDFCPLKESSIVPIWIRVEGLPLYLFDEMPLLSISKAIGCPIKVDSRNVNRTMLHSARICVELDVCQPMLDKILVSFKDEISKNVVEKFWVKVFYDAVPQFCSSCGHIGHGMGTCKRIRMNLVQGKDMFTNAGQVIEEPVARMETATEGISASCGVYSKTGIYVSVGMGQNEVQPSTDSGLKASEIQGRIEYNTDLKQGVLSAALHTNTVATVDDGTANEVITQLVQLRGSKTGAYEAETQRGATTSVVAEEIAAEVQPKQNTTSAQVKPGVAKCPATSWRINNQQRYNSRSSPDQGQSEKIAPLHNSRDEVKPTAEGGMAELITEKATNIVINRHVPEVTQQQSTVPQVSALDDRNDALMKETVATVPTVGQGEYEGVRIVQTREHAMETRFKQQSSYATVRTYRDQPQKISTKNWVMTAFKTTEPKPLLEVDIGAKQAEIIEKKLNNSGIHAGAKTRNQLSPLVNIESMEELQKEKAGSHTQVPISQNSNMERKIFTVHNRDNKVQDEKEEKRTKSSNIPTAQKPTRTKEGCPIVVFKKSDGRKWMVQTRGQGLPYDDKG